MNQKMKKVGVIGLVLLLVGLAGFLVLKRFGPSKEKILATSIFALDKTMQLLPIKEDTKKEIETVDKLVAFFTQKDGVERKLLVLLQNNMELRPGGGFLGQYAVAKVKNGELTSLFVEDANLLDQRIEADVAPPYPFQKMMSIKRWKFRDSNFSPDYPTNVEKAKYFYRLAGGANDFFGVVAVNAQVLSDVLEITGPMTVPGYPGEYNSDNAVLKLEEQVEKGFENQGIAVQNRKLILKKMAQMIADKLANPVYLTKLSQLGLEELRNKNVMLNFTDKNLQSEVEAVHWDGQVNQDWDKDYLMAVDANMGALKSDYYIERSMDYVVDLTTEKPTAELKITYKHNATYGDWRTSDYHSYLRVYAPKGANLLEREMVSYPNVQEEFGKTYFGFILHVLIGRETVARLKYELPETVRDDYKLLIQKQSGVGDVPVRMVLKTADGEFTREEILKKDLELTLGEEK